MSDRKNKNSKCSRIFRLLKAYGIDVKDVNHKIKKGFYGSFPDLNGELKTVFLGYSIPTIKRKILDGFLKEYK